MLLGRVRAQDAAIIYSLDPVYGAVFSWLLLGESLGPQGLVGGGLVLTAVALSRSDAFDAPSVESKRQCDVGVSPDTGETSGEVSDHGQNAAGGE